MKHYGPKFVPSGDEQTFDVVDVDQYIDITETTEPADPDSTHGRIWIEDSQGFSVTKTKDASGVVFQHFRDSVLIVRNSSGSTISQGAPVYISGSTGSVPQISLAQADSTSTMPTVGIVIADISNNSFGRVLINGNITGLDLSSFNDGDILWVSAASAGTLTSTEPSHPNLHQQVGVVINAAVNGTLLVNILHAGGDDSGTENATYTIGAAAASSVVLTPASTAQRTITFQDASGTVAFLTDVTSGGGFYGVYFEESESGGYSERDDTLIVDSNSFYMTSNNSGKPVLSLNEQLTVVPQSDSDATPFDHGFATNFVSFTMADDSVTRLDFVYPGIISVTFQAATSGDDTRFGALGFQVNDTTNTLYGGTNWQHLAASDSAPAVGSITDGNLGFQASASTTRIWMVNRLGGSRTFRLFFMHGYTTPTEPVTATGL